MSRVIDIAWGRPSYASVKAAGAVAVCRYLSYDTTGKTLSKTEADGWRTNGIDLVSNWEQAGSWTEYSGGQTTGRSHAAEANRQHIACGGPPARPIFFSTDWNVTSTQMGAVAEYYRGVASVIGLARTGAYGGYPVIKYLFDQGVIAWGWQTYAWSAFRDDPSGQIYLHWDRRAQLRQVQNGVTIGGVDCDLDDSTSADFGQWGAGGTVMPDYALGSERYLYNLHKLQANITGPAGSDFADAVVHSDFVDAIVAIRDGIKSLAGQVAAIATPLDPADVASLVTAALIASGTNPLTDADHAGVRADVEAVLTDYLRRMAAGVVGTK